MPSSEAGCPTAWEASGYSSLHQWSAGGAIIGTSFAETFPMFSLLGIVGSGTLGGLSFYHITQTTAVRITPDAPTKAIARLTIWGALSSPIFLPVSAWLVQTYHWRTAIRVLAVPATVFLVLSAFAVRARPAHSPQRVLRFLLRAARDSAEIRRFLMASAMGGMVLSILLVYQVPVMTSLGLPLATAAWIAALRGFSQLLGRIPLTPIVERLGARGATQMALMAVGIGILLLTGSGQVIFGVAFALLAGFGIEAMSPLQGIYTNELYDAEGLGSAMGFVTVLFASFGALGPAIVGALADATGSRLCAVVIGATAAGLGAILLIPRR